MPLAIMECTDFSEFQETLKNMRRTDDIIINTINSVVPTDSFHTDVSASCKNLYDNLEDGNIKREKHIKNCISVTADRVKRLKEQKDVNSEDVDLRKQLRAEQTKLRMLQVELSVEDLIRQRTSKVFNEKCRKYYKPL
ncbi:hypothetical protein NQ317_005023 [Molorchus minor]|uniref:Protein MIX23 n=1 Tax=Molorchus minor TaxID=1323400 RepID=A0ABQ9K567_9CUCU|nr:hypothetical protein NQ317_005023 [Molorchus minor]